MDKDKKIVICFVLFPFIIVILGVCLLASTLGGVMIHINNFAVDSTGRLYLQNEDDRTSILVYKNKMHIDTINLNEALKEASDEVVIKGVFFTIKNDTIVVATSDHVCKLDLQGNLIDYSRDRTNIQGRLSGQSQFIADNGDVYQRKNVLGRTSIVKNNAEVVYQISILSVILKWISGISTVLLVIVIITVIKYYWKERY